MGLMVAQYAGSDIGGEEEMWSGARSVSHDNNRRASTWSFLLTCQLWLEQLWQLFSRACGYQPFRMLRTSNWLKWLIDLNYDCCISDFCVWKPPFIKLEDSCSYRCGFLSSLSRSYMLTTKAIYTNDMPDESWDSKDTMAHVSSFCELISNNIKNTLFRLEDKSSLKTQLGWGAQSSESLSIHTLSHTQEAE